MDAHATVVDLGGRYIRAGSSFGFPRANEPQVVVPAAARVPADAGGAAAAAVVPAIRRGAVVDWDVLEAVLEGALYGRLGWVRGEEGPLLVSEPALTPRADRERLCALAFEHFNVAQYFAADAPLLSLYAVGRASGVVVDAGHDRVDVVPVLDGAALGGGAARLPYGGGDLTALLARLVGGRPGGPALDDAAAEALKHLCMAVAPSAADAAAEPAARTAYALPDGQSIEVGREGAALGEALLRPGEFGLGGLGPGAPGLADVVAAAAAAPVPAAEREARKALAEGLLCAGGGGAVPGLAPRLVAELRPGAHPAAPPGAAGAPPYLPAPGLGIAAWLGGAVLARLVFSRASAAAPAGAVTRAEYDECGPAALHRRAA